MHMNARGQRAARCSGVTKRALDLIVPRAECTGSHQQRNYVHAAIRPPPHSTSGEDDSRHSPSMIPPTSGSSSLEPTAPTSPRQKLRVMTARCVRDLPRASPPPNTPPQKTVLQGPCYATSRDPTNGLLRADHRGSDCRPQRKPSREAARGEQHSSHPPSPSRGL